MKAYAVMNLILLACSAPWIFIGMEAGSRVEGLPLWAAYCLAVMLIYAVFVALSLGRLWDSESAQEEDDDG